MLTKQLRELESDGIVHRRVYPMVPPKLEYSLTEYGRSLKRPLRAISDWGSAHMERIGAVEASTTPTSRPAGPVAAAVTSESTLPARPAMPTKAQ
jgi:DNA-binding HxlR family transcriptional regulator